MGRFQTAAKKARNLTNKQLASEITDLTPFSRDRLKEFLPTKRDKETFLALMKEVEAETAEDTKLAYLKENIESAGRVVFKVLKTFI